MRFDTLIEFIDVAPAAQGVIAWKDTNNAVFTVTARPARGAISPLSPTNEWSLSAVRDGSEVKITATYPAGSVLRINGVITTFRGATWADAIVANVILDTKIAFHIDEEPYKADLIGTTGGAGAVRKVWGELLTELTSETIGTVNGAPAVQTVQERRYRVRRLPDALGLVGDTMVIDGRNYAITTVDFERSRRRWMLVTGRRVLAGG